MVITIDTFEVNSTQQSLDEDFESKDSQSSSFSVLVSIKHLTIKSFLITAYVVKSWSQVEADFW